MKEKNHYPVKRVDSEMGWYSYRNFSITRNDDVPAGYWGRYKVDGIQKGGYITDTLKDCKRKIDDFFDQGDSNNEQ